MRSEELKQLDERLTNVIKDYCNTLGCGNCGLWWDGGCAATDLQNKIFGIEMREYNETN